MSGYILRFKRYSANGRSLTRYVFTDYIFLSFIVNNGFVDYERLTIQSYPSGDQVEISVREDASHGANKIVELKEDQIREIKKLNEEISEHARKAAQARALRDAAIRDTWMHSKGMSSDDLAAIAQADLEQQVSRDTSKGGYWNWNGRGRIALNE